MTAGIRHFHYDEYEVGSEYYSATSSILNIRRERHSVRRQGRHACIAGMNLHKSESGNNTHNLTWHIIHPMLAYSTYSLGFPPGGLGSRLADGSTIDYKAFAPYSSAIAHSDQLLKPVGYIKQPAPAMKSD